MNNRQIYQEFKNLGRDLFLNGDAAARNGNISLLLSNGRLAITRSGSLLSDLLPSDIILVRLEKNKTSPLASSELPVHRAIILKTGKKAVVHAHCPYTVALANRYGRTFPNGEYKAKFGYPLVIGQAEDFRIGGYSEEIAAALKEHGVCVVADHGLFAAGDSLKEAYVHLSALEASSKIAYLERALS